MKPFYKFDHILADDITNNVNTNQPITRHVTDGDRTCLKEALQEVQLSLAVSAGVTLFDSSGLITHGFSDNIIESITLNCDKIFNIHDLMEYGFISSIHLAFVVLEVFNEIFEDVEIDTSLYNIATLTVPVYNTILNATATLHQIGQCTKIIPHLTVMNDVHLYVISYLLLCYFIFSTEINKAYFHQSLFKISTNYRLLFGGGFINPFPMF